ncbi:MAG: hypothetical protein ACK4K7_09615 [Allosphingosinicella sp.]|uniref:hypothetical protein n=1 Tax=Allosphingosinicella sp. TaxID=2823234 RepID=UPI00395362AC
MGERGRKGTGTALVLTGTRRPQLRRQTKVRWTATRVAHFFDVLAASCNVAEACRQSGLDERGAFRRRRTDADFRARWKIAIDEAHARLQLMLLERMMNGTVKQVLRGDVVFDLKEYSNSVAFALLKAHGDTAAEAAAEAEMPEEEIEAVRQRILGKLKAVRRRMAAEAQAQAEVEAEGAGAADPSGAAR